MYPKKISVLLTTFNGSKYIKQQLDSIFAQDILPDEIIICDDNSPDETGSLLRNYKGNGVTPIKLFVNEKQLGVVQNFKKAAKLAKKGNWLAFSDQDDIWMPQKLKKLGEKMKQIDNDILPALVYSDLALINRNNAVTAGSFWEKQNIKPSTLNFPRLLYGNTATGCTMLINYPMAEELFSMDSNQFLHDEWLTLIAYSFGKVNFLTDKLVLYRQHENNLTFSEDYQYRGVLGNMIEDFRYLTGRKNFLLHQFELAKAFLAKYNYRLNGEQIKILENFINQENKNYLLQRIRRRITYF